MTSPSLSLNLPGHHCILNGVRYNLRSPVSRFVVSQYPGKITIGDQTRDSRPHTSLYAQTDWSGGVGLERLQQGQGSADRIWWGTMDLNFNGHMVLPRRADAIPKPVGAGELKGLDMLGGSLYGVFLKDVYSYDGASWGSALHTLRGSFNSMEHSEIDGEDYLVVAHEEGIAYTNDGIDWADTGPVQ